MKEVRIESKFSVDLQLREAMEIIDTFPETVYKLAVSLMAFDGLRSGKDLAYSIMTLTLTETR